MAGILKPDGLTGREGTYKIWYYNLYDPAENLFNGSATAVYNGAYAGTSVRKNQWYAYWASAGDYLDIEFYEDIIIWDYGIVAFGADRRGALAVYENKNGIKGEFITDLLEHSLVNAWKMIGCLPKGRYRIEYKSLWRVSTEWYLEVVKKRKSLIKIDNKYYTLQNGEFIELELTLGSFEEYGLTDLSQLTTSTNKLIEILENSEIIVLSDGDEIPKLHIEGFRDLRPFCESDNPKLLINTEQSTSPIIKTESMPQGQLILPLKDIYLRMLSNIQSFIVTPMGDVTGIIRLIFSVNSGASWQTLDITTGQFKTLDNIENLDKVKAEGMTIETFNSIGLKWNEVIKGMSVRFGYYLEIEETSDIANVDKLEVIMDVLGSWEALIHELDYDYEYDNEKIYIELYRDGSYKINYI